MKKRILTGLFITLLFTGCSVKLTVTDSVKPVDFNKHPVVFMVNHDMTCEFDNGPYPFLFTLKKGEGLLPVSMDGIKVSIMNSLSDKEALPPYTIGLSGLSYEGINGGLVGFYLLVYPDGNFISDASLFTTSESDNTIGDLHRGSCGLQEGQVPFTEVTNP